MRRAVPLCRFSPARAGNRKTTACVRCRTSVQPRACGEQDRAGRRRVRRSGSAPRVRGTVPRPNGGHNRHRFSPARAGNRRDCAGRAAAPTVQPCACGEQWIFRLKRPCKHGSAPRVRGTAQDQRPSRPSGRFSPARAGNRLFGSGLSATTCGSAPRVRGTDAVVAAPRNFNRFSPARAGNRSPTTAPAISCTVQPRACGEQSAYTLIAGLFRGSAPRVRGTADQHRRR